MDIEGAFVYLRQVSVETVSHVIVNLQLTALQMRAQTHIELTVNSSLLRDFN